MRVRLNPLLKRIAADGNSAVFSDEIFLTVNVGGDDVEIYLRFSVVMEFIKGKWVVVHWHGSKPEYVSSETDTFGIEVWKTKNAELEKIVVERTLELTRQKQELEQALNDLHITQAQLIQSEKMASLGELTAGIAHEIQNPLNFVNNFSEINKELLSELKEEIDKGKLEDVKSLANDVIENEEKINHHGKRADAIVKGMLQHSRSSTATKEPVDINSLADEYFRLAYHGLRAKNKSFNATLKTDYDENIGKVNIIPQDIGRVILNLITNAFYSVNEKALSCADTFEPTVTISTKKTGKHVEISVADNGNGMSPAIAAKIFQPFFTTKPTGQGTGLGLSMSYDIVTKGHGGELKAMTNEEGGATFKIILSP
jgi:signal transduction histidine kinase